MGGPLQPLGCEGGEGRRVQIGRGAVANRAAGPVVEIDAEEAAAFKDKAQRASGSASERAALRASAPPDSAELVCFEGKCLGVRAGEEFFSFRGVPPTAAAALEAEVEEMEVYCSIDLLAMASALGHGDTSGCICAWCRSNAAGFKLSAGVEKKVLERRTLVTEAADLAAHLAEVEKKKKNKNLPEHINGVSGPSLFAADFNHLVPPYLDLILGLTNDGVKEMLAALAKLGCVDPAAMLRQLERNTVLEDLEGLIGEAVGELAQIFGPAVRRAVAKMVDEMDSADDEVGVQAEAEAKARREVEATRAAELETAERLAAAEAGTEIIPQEEDTEESDDAAEEAGAAGGGRRAVTAPTGSRVVAGALAAANWAPLLEEARRLATAKKEEGEASAQRWREPVVARAAAAAAGQPGQTSKKRAKANEADRKNEE